MLLSEMFGVERDTEFGVEGYSVTFKIATFLEEYEYLMYRWSAKLDWREAEGTMLCNVIAGAPGNIVRLPPPLTEEQRVVLMSLFTMGARYMGMTPDGWKRCFVNKPQKEGNTWMRGDTGDKKLLTIASGMANCLDSLVSWSDPEPYDIGKALGVEG